MLLSNAFDPDPRVSAEAVALGRAGARTSLIAWDREARLPVREVRSGVRIRRVRVRSRDGRGRGQAPRLAAFWAGAAAVSVRSRFDLVWCHDLDTLLPGLALGRVRGVPVVFDAHESYPDMVAASLGPALTGCLRGLERRLVRRADAVVTVGRRLADHLAGLGARRVVVAGNWKDPEAFAVRPERRAELRCELGVPDGAWLVGSIGWLGPERRLDELTTAVAGDRDCWLLVGGRGPMAEAVRAAAGRCPRIRFPGWIAPARVPELTAACDAVFYGFDPENGNARFSAPNKLFEALAAGIPVLTGPLGEIEEIVRRRGVGVVVPRYSVSGIRAGLKRLREMGSLRAACRAAGRCYSRARADRVLVRTATALVRPGPGRGAVP